MPQMQKRAALLVFGAVLLLFLGLIYAYSVLLAPLKAEFGWSVANMTLVFALSICSFTVGSLFSGPLIARGRSALGFFIGAALIGGGFLGTAAASGAASLGIVLAAYGVLASLGIGLVYNIVIPTVTSWFPDACGMAQGICLMGFGSGGFLLGPVATALYGGFPWRGVLVGFGAVFAALVSAGALVMRQPGAEEVVGAGAGAARGAGAGPAAGASAPTADVGTAQMLRTRTFWLLYAFLFMLGSIGMGVTGIGREIPGLLGADGLAAAMVIGCVNVGSGVGRLCCGMALDRFGRAATMRVIGAGGLLAPVVMAASLLCGSLAVQALACLVTGASWGAAVVTMPYVSRTEWGQSTMARNMAVVNTYSIFASIVGSFGAGMLFEAAGSLFPVLGIMAALGAMSLFLAGRIE